MFQQPVDDLIIENHRVKGVITQMGLEFFSDKVILTSGTFLGGIIHIGKENYQGGRAAMRLQMFYQKSYDHMN